MKTNKKAFTLIELMVVMAIIAVLAVLIIGAITIARRTQEETKHRNNAKVLQTALERYFTRHKAYCGTDPLTGPVCGTNYNFDSLKTALELDLGNGSVKLASTSCGETAYNLYFIQTAFAKRPPSEPTPQPGGGSTYVTERGYTLSPAKYDCKTYNTSDEIIIAE